MGFDESRLGCHGLEITKDGIEALDMPHLKYQILLSTQSDQFGGLLGCFRHRFLNENVFALLEQVSGEIEMGHRGRHDTDCVRVLRGLGKGAGQWHLKSLRQSRCGRRVLIEDSGDLDRPRFGEFRVEANMMAAQRPRSDDRHFDRMCHGPELSVGKAERRFLF